MTKTILITAILGEPHLTDHYGNFRGEGRIPINIGFGLMELGYDVNIVYEQFKDLIFTSNGGSVILSKTPIKEKYDFQLFWDRVQPVKSKKEICIINYSHEIKRFEGRLALNYVTPYKGLVELMQIESGRPVEYLPQINPITSYNVGFKSFIFDISNKPMINVFVYISSWERITLCIEEFIIILERMKYLLNNRGHKVKLYIQINNDEMKKDCKDIMKYGDEIEFVGKYKYDDYLRMIENMDMFVLKGNQFMASAGMYDIISLGKPMLYVSESFHGGTYRNPLFQYTNEIIFSGNNRLDISRKVDSFVKNPEILYNKFRNALSDSDFNRWKEYALKIFK